MQLSLKPKTFFDCFVPFPESTLNFKHFEKEIIIIATFFRILQTLNDLVRPLSKKHRFKAPFASQHVKWCQTFVESA